MTEWLGFERDSVKLSVLDFGGEGQPVLLLHGLAGHCGEWAQTASWLAEHHRVFAPDARGHGRSQRIPADVSPDALIADVAFIARAVASGPVVVVGQSIGGVTALMLAARHPELVHALVMVDASPNDGGDADQAGQEIGEALASWPVPFPSQSAAAQFFRTRFGDGAAVAWADGLEEHADGWRPRFDIDVMTRTVAAMHAHSSWPCWEALRCPVLVVRAGHGVIDPQTVHEMAARLPASQIVELPNARHDVHLDRPEEWREALTAFLALTCEPDWS